MYSRILVAVDGSANSDRALLHAIDVARASNAALRIAHVVDMGWTPAALELGIDLRASAEARRSAGQAVIASALAVVEKAGLQAEPLLIETATPAERIGTAIVDAADGWHADLLVLGTCGHKGFERLLLGSVSDSVARRSTAPVLLVP
jgi:nucleotide-binding universal stress UspA family protein